MAQLPFVVLSCFCFHQRDLLHPRVIIASYNPHVGSFLPSLGLVSAPSLRGARSRHCYEIMWNKLPALGPKCYAIALLVLAIPTAWMGGALRLTQLRRQI